MRPTFHSKLRESRPRTSPSRLKKMKVYSDRVSEWQQLQSSSSTFYYLLWCGQQSVHQASTSSPTPCTFHRTHRADQTKKMAAESKVVCDLVDSLLSQPSIMEAISHTLDVPRNPQTHVRSDQTFLRSSNANTDSLSISRSNYNTRYRNRGQEVDEEVRRVFSRGRCSSNPMESSNSAQQQSETRVQSSMTQSPIFHFTRNFGRQNGERMQQPKYTRRHFRGPPTFTKEVILLSGPHDEIVVKQGTKQFLYESGHIITTFEFNKLWTNHEVQDQLHVAFSPKIDNIE
ncbi:uncharacterized protein LOC144828029 [Lissotriton helveticus]